MDPKLFIEETGKTAVVVLEHLGGRGVLAKVTAGDRVLLKVQGRQVYVTTLNSEYLGQLGPRLGLRLANLMQGGNRYEAAVTSVSEHQVKAIIREVYQAPAMAGRVSFPFRTDTGFRPYIKESILRYGLEEEEGYAEEEEPAEWDEEGTEEGGLVAEALPLEQDEEAEEEEY